MDKIKEIQDCYYNIVSAPDRSSGFHTPSLVGLLQLIKSYNISLECMEPTQLELGGYINIRSIESDLRSSEDKSLVIDDAI